MINLLLILLLLMQGGSGTVSSKLQESASSTAKPKVFEVVSIKPSKPDTTGGTQDFPDGFRYTNIAIDVVVDGA